MATMMNETQDLSDPERNNDFIEVKCNWEIKNDKNIQDTFSIISATQAPDRLGIEDIVSLKTCLVLSSSTAESDPCIDIKLTNNQRIKRIAVVSEARILEFYKQCGEYSSTQFAEFIDEFENQSVYIGEATIDTPTSEASIKFTKIKRKNPEMWLYGIKLILTDEKEEKSSGMFNLDVINGFLANSKFMNSDKASAAKKVLNTFSFHDKDLSSLDFEACVEKLFSSSEPNLSKQLKVEEKRPEYKEYIDRKFDEMEKRITTKIEDMEMRINFKLDTILALINK